VKQFHHTSLITLLSGAKVSISNTFYHYPTKLPKGREPSNERWTYLRHSFSEPNDGTIANQFRLFSKQISADYKKKTLYPSIAVILTLIPVEISTIAAPDRVNSSNSSSADGIPTVLWVRRGERHRINVMIHVRRYQTKLSRTSSRAWRYVSHDVTSFSSNMAAVMTSLQTLYKCKTVMIRKGMFVFVWRPRFVILEKMGKGMNLQIAGIILW